MLLHRHSTEARSGYGGVDTSRLLYVHDGPVTHPSWHRGHQDSSRTTLSCVGTAPSETYANTRRALNDPTIRVMSSDSHYRSAGD